MFLLTTQMSISISKENYLNNISKVHDTPKIHHVILFQLCLNCAQSSQDFILVNIFLPFIIEHATTAQMKSAHIASCDASVYLR